MYNGTRYLALLRVYLYIQNEPRAIRTKSRADVILMKSYIYIPCSTGVFKDIPQLGDELSAVGVLFTHGDNWTI